jgi:hypothetical protein
MFLEYEEIPAEKSKERSHTFNPWVSYDPNNKNCLQLKVYVRTARMPYAKVENFLDMERFHDTLVCNFRTLRNEKSSFNYDFLV